MMMSSYPIFKPALGILDHGRQDEMDAGELVDSWLRARTDDSRDYVRGESNYHAWETEDVPITRQPSPWILAW